MHVIGIEGKAGSGKSTVAKNIVKKLNNYLHVEESDLLLMFVDVAIHLKETFCDDEKIIEEINNIKVSYGVNDNKVKFILDYETIDNSMTALEKKLFVAKNAELKKSVEKKIYSEFNNIISKIKNDYNIVISGHELEKACPNVDLLFLLLVDDEVREKRQINRDKDEEKIKIREKEEGKLFEDSKKAIIIDSTDLSVDEISEKIISFLSSSSGIKESF